MATFTTPSGAKVDEEGNLIESGSDDFDPMTFEAGGGTSTSGGGTSSTDGTSSGSSSSDASTEDTNTITAGDLTGTSSLLQPDAAGEVSVTSVTDLPELSDELRREMFPDTERKGERDETLDRIQDSTSELARIGDFRGEQREKQGIAQKKQLVTDLANRLRTLKTQEKQIPLQLQEESRGRGRTRQGLKPLETARLRQNAIRAMGTSAQLQAAQGNLSTAQDLVDQAVQAEFDPIRQRLAQDRKNLRLINDAIEDGRIERTSARELALKQRQEELDRRDQQIKRAEQQRRDILDLSNTAAENNAPASVVRDIQNAETVAEAQRIAAENNVYQTPEEAQQEDALVESGALRYTRTDFQEDSAILEDTRGEDGYVNTKEYTDLYRGWLQLGGRPQDFLDTFPPEFYVKPDDPTVPQALRPEGASSNNQDRFLTTDFFRQSFGEEQLKQNAAEEGLTREGRGPGLFGIGEVDREVGDVDAYLQNLMRTVQSYRDAGYSDQEIFELMQSDE